VIVRFVDISGIVSCWY